ncbi:MAG: DegV family protein [Actinobacteria bacterium]|nr:DegV family protein [Actinomycetota bacterium]
MPTPIIICDSTCDLSVEETQALNVIMLSLKVNFGAESYEDKRTITNEEFYEKLEKSEELPTTSLLNVGDFLNVFTKYPNEEIVVLTLSSKLSGTYQSAVMAKAQLERDNIYLVDTATVAIGLGMLVKLAAQKRDEGMAAREIASFIQDISKRVRVYAVLDTLKYLVKGGRLSSVQGAIGSMLTLKPTIALQDGLVNSIAKNRGMDAAIKNVVEIIDTQDKIDRSMPISFCHSGNLPALKKLVAKLGGDPNVEYGYLGSVVGTHTGPGTIAVSYFAEE